MFLGRKNQYYENDYTTKAIHRFNVIPIKSLVAFFTEVEQKKFTFVFHLKPQKTLNSQSSLEKEEWRWRNQTS